MHTTAGQLVTSERGVCGGPLPFHYANLGLCHILHSASHWPVLRYFIKTYAATLAASTEEQHSKPYTSQCRTGHGLTALPITLLTSPLCGSSPCPRQLVSIPCPAHLFVSVVKYPSCCISIGPALLLANQRQPHCSASSCSFRLVDRHS
jgi:hypothetical protein